MSKKKVPTNRWHKGKRWDMARMECINRSFNSSGVGRCGICMLPLDRNATQRTTLKTLWVEIDHINPPREDTPELWYNPDNLQATHSFCNRSKSNFIASTNLTAKILKDFSEYLRGKKVTMSNDGSRLLLPSELLTEEGEKSQLLYLKDLANNINQKMSKNLDAQFFSEFPKSGALSSGIQW